MGDTVKALKALAVAMGCAEATSAISGATIPEVIRFMAENYPTSQKKSETAPKE